MMMSKSCGAVAVAVAALLVCCSADHQEEDGSVGEHNSGYDTTGSKTHNLDSPGEGHMRATREIHHGLPYPVARRLEYTSAYGPKHDLWPMMADYFEGLNKRNFDEIDRSDLDPFAKRNFDEIDQTSMPFPYAAKRFYHLYANNYLDTPPYSSFDKKRLYRPEYPMDEIDLSHFPIGSKRSLNSFPFPHTRR